MVGRPHVMGGPHKLFMAGIIGALLALPASAMAQSATEGYRPPGAAVQEQIQAAPAQAQEQVPSRPTPTPTPAQVTAAAPSRGAAELPFTGLDLALVVGAGGVLLLLGVGIRRLTRTSEVA
jgi:hypothetical protein